VDSAVYLALAKTTKATTIETIARGGVIAKAAKNTSNNNIKIRNTIINGINNINIGNNISNIIIITIISDTGNTSCSNITIIKLVIATARIPAS
jgi:hypothetical protein